jgi:hypothetical protein
MCWWHAEFPFELGPDVLVLFQETVLGAGAATGVFRVDEIRRLGYHRDRDGDIVDFVRTHADQLPSTDPLLPTGFALDDLAATPSPGRVSSTLLTVADASGALRDEWVADMADLGIRLGLQRCYARPPVEIFFDLGVESDPELAVWWLDFSLSTDIFLPWSSAFSHDVFLSEPLDNRVLAGRNAPRLNSFLRQLREAALAVGGRWTARRSRRYADQVDEFGVLLDAPRPDWSR